MTLGKLQETLFILHKCATTIDRVYKALEEHHQKGPLFSFHHFSHNLAYYLVMETISFLDEYDSFFTAKNVESGYQHRVLVIRKIAKPLYKKILNWKDLRKYRNSIIAHGLRDEKNSNRLVIPNKKHYDVPKTIFEFALLRDLIKLFFGLITLEFQDELNVAVWHAYAGESDEKKKKDYSNINTELQIMLDEMNTIQLGLGKEYALQMKGYRLTQKGAYQKNFGSVIRFSFSNNSEFNISRNSSLPT